jgi:hypothetical protein
MRKAKNFWPDKKRAGGSHQGVAPANMAWEVYMACSDGERINTETYEALHTTIDLDGLYDILEMKDVLQSWKSAALKNMDT